MAITIQSFSIVGPSLKTITDADADSTAERNIAGGGATIYSVRIDNSANAAEAEHVKFYNNGAPTVGTTAPEMILPVAGAARNTWVFRGLENVFTTALSVAGVQEAGTAGTSSPSANTAIDVTVYG